MIIPIDLNGYDLELDEGIRVKRIFDNETGETIDRQDKDDQGLLLWTMDVSLWKGDDKLGDLRVTVHSAFEPIINKTGRHTLVRLKDPRANVWGSASRGGFSCNFHCYGVENAEAANEAKK